MANFGQLTGRYEGDPGGMSFFDSLMRRTPMEGRTEYGGTVPAQGEQPARVMINAKPERSYEPSFMGQIGESLGQILSFPQGAAFGTGSPAETSEQPSALSLARELSARFTPAPASPESENVLFKTASPFVNITDGDINRGMDVAMATSGGGLSTKGIRAYHGSPHDFDKFDLSKIGTGEGAQAYGHGLYFAEKEATAKGYREALTRDKDRMLEPGGRLPPWVASAIESQNPVAIDDMRKTFAARIAEAEAEAKTSVQPWLYPGKIQGLQDILKSIDEFAGGAAMKPPGRMYEVNINADPAHFLDWDKPLTAAAPRQVQDAFNQVANNSRPEIKDKLYEAFRQQQPGSIYYSILNDAAKTGNLVKNQTAATSALHEAGIPGIKYLDQGSRGAGQGSSNYVVFNDKLIDIVKKYAAAGIALPPAIASEYARMTGTASYADALGSEQ